MKYNIQKLDRRHSYHDWFQYYLGFPQTMHLNQGPLNFTRVQKWCFQTWGWSAEIRLWSDIYRHYTNRAPMMRVPGGFVRQLHTDLPEECNSNWSWTNGVNGDLRIYLRSDTELSFLLLAHPCQQ